MFPRLLPALRTWQSVLSESNLRRVELAFIGFNVAEFGTWIAMLVFAYRVGGVAAAGLIGAIQLIPSAVFAPIAASLGDRYRLDRLLTAGYVAQVLANLAAGIILLTGPPLPLVYAVATLAAMTVTLTRPVQGALLPSLARTVPELTAANVVSGWIEGVSIVVGPLLTGALLAAAAPGAVFLVMAAVLVGSVALTARVSVASSCPGATSDEGWSLIGSISSLAAEPRSRAVLSLLTAHFFLQGATDVVFVILAFQVLHIGGSGVGLMNAAYGMGGLLATGLMAGMVGRRSLLPSLAGGTAGWGLGLGGVTVLAVPAVSPILIGMAGAGRPLVDVAGRTLLQRVVAVSMLARAFGLLEGLAMAAMAGGMLLVPLLFRLVGAPGTFGVLGAVLPIALIVLWRPLRRCDGVAAPAAALDAICGVPFFAPLSALLIEQLAMNLRPVEVPAGTAIVREGEPGNEFYIIEAGEALASAAGLDLRRLGAGDFFGEIALLRAVPRTATVTALTDLRLYGLARRHFLEALTGQAIVRQAAESVVEARLQTSSEAGRAVRLE